MLRKLIAPVYLNGGKAVVSLSDAAPYGDADAVALAEGYSNRGADRLIIFDQSDSDETHDVSLTLMRRMGRGQRKAPGRREKDPVRRMQESHPECRQAIES